MNQYKKNKNIKLRERRGRNFGKRQTGFPNSERITLTYADLITQGPGLYRDTYIFRGNSVFDPDFTSTGHQPRYFDTYATVYSKYRVLGSSIKIEMINGTPTSGAIFSIVPLTDTIAPTTFYQASELPLVKISDIMPVASRYPFDVSHSITTKRILGLLGREIEDDTFAAAVTGNPANVWYWNVSTFSVDNTTNVAYSFHVTINYDCVFYDRNNIPISFKMYQNPEVEHDKIERQMQPSNVLNNVKLQL